MVSNVRLCRVVEAGDAISQLSNGQLIGGLFRALDQRQGENVGLLATPSQQSSSLYRSSSADEDTSSGFTNAATQPLDSSMLWTPDCGTAINWPQGPKEGLQRLTPIGSTPESSGNKQGANDSERGNPGFSAILDDGVAEEAVCLYTGDQQGLGLVVDISKSTLLPEDLAALHAKNCFTLPPERVRKQLLRCYFCHVHPFFPILEAKMLIVQYETGGPKQVNLLLLWSMFFASTNFLDNEAVTLAGYSSRKTMKRSLYQRAKALYDADYEKDKIPLIQSVLLLAFWYADSEDRDGSWHWIGIAISLCQTMGLHRNPSSEHRANGGSFLWQRQTVPPEQLRLWRLIWWMCYFRDTWLSFGMGRPTRTSLSDCDMPMPTVADFEAINFGMSSRHAEEYLPQDENRILRLLWVCLFDITLALGNILKNHYRPKKTSQHPIEAIAQDRERLLQCRSRFPSEDLCESSPVLSHMYHLYIYHEACQIALHRPYMAGKPGRPVDTTEETWKVQALRRGKIAASNIDSVLSKIDASGLMSTCQPMMVTAMIPALQIHLFESVSSDLVAKRLGRHHLDILMIMLSELRTTYWAADFIYSLFDRARKKLDSGKTRGSKRPLGSARTETLAHSMPPNNAPGDKTDARTHIPTTPQSPTNEHPAIRHPSRLASPQSTAATPHEVHRHGNEDPDPQLSGDIGLALAYDILPFQFDLGSSRNDFGAFDPTVAMFERQGNDSLNFCLSDRDLNLLFEVDNITNLPSRE
ncbi:hypothetical protein G7046_g6331 [Stylonectria norvegica]|nr:hypothetical protein G7046_g6331 [Stylonectria norvegica]